MRKDGDRPELGQSSSSLGIRVPIDIEPDNNGRVHPGTGGLSVRPNLYSFGGERIPKRLMHLMPSARGSNTLYVWSIGDGGFDAGLIAAGLQLRPDPDEVGHGFIEPETSEVLSDYLDAITATRGNWRLEEGSDDEPR